MESLSLSSRGVYIIVFILVPVSIACGKKSFLFSTLVERPFCHFIMEGNYHVAQNQITFKG